ncbi:MAG: hypothetical protein M3R36_02525 [Bacteroidota bacterium]|nr:hypothetical protein [Bacteroidota bacterium]
MKLVKTIKGELLRNKYVKKLNNTYKVKKFYSNRIKTDGIPETIMFWSTGGMLMQSNIEGMIASSLKLRGHKVHMVICDSVYKACARRVDHPDVSINDWYKYCPSCIRNITRLIDRLGISYSYVSDYIPENRQAELKRIANEVDYENHTELTLNGIHLGSHLVSALLRHTKGSSYESMYEIIKEFAYTVLITAEATHTAIKKLKPTKVYMSHGIYADWGPALSVSLKENLPVSSYFSCYLTAHFYFGTVNNFNETFLTISMKSWDKYKNLTLTEIQKQRLYNFLYRRYLHNETADMIGILKEYKGENKHFYEKYNLDPEKPIWGIMTHINWDAISDYFQMIYKNFDEWLYETIKEIYNVKEVQWLIKIHPSELNDNPFTGCQKFIENNFPDLPPHIKIIKMDDEISPKDFYNLLDGGVTVMGTGGLELSIQGKPVILAGDAHYSNKGFTYDAKSDKQYKELLNNAKNIGPLVTEKNSLALKYGYIYFILKQIPLLPAIKEDLFIDFNNIKQLLPGNNKFIDFLCDVIITGGDFILPENLVDQTHLIEKKQMRQFH